MLLGNNDAAARLKTINNEFFFLIVHIIFLREQLVQNEILKSVVCRR